MKGKEMKGKRNKLAFSDIGDRAIRSYIPPKKSSGNDLPWSIPLLLRMNPSSRTQTRGQAAWVGWGCRVGRELMYLRMKEWLQHVVNGVVGTNGDGTHAKGSTGKLVPQANSTHDTVQEWRAKENFPPKLAPISDARQTFGFLAGDFETAGSAVDLALWVLDAGFEMKVCEQRWVSVSGCPNKKIGRRNVVHLRPPLADAIAKTHGVFRCSSPNKNLLVVFFTTTSWRGSKTPRNMLTTHKREK